VAGIYIYSFSLPLFLLVASLSLACSDSNIVSPSVVVLEMSLLRPASVFILLTLITAALAVTIDTHLVSGVEASKTYTITYSPKDQPTSAFQAHSFFNLTLLFRILRRGPSISLDIVAVWLDTA